MTCRYEISLGTSATLLPNQALVTKAGVLKSADGLSSPAAALTLTVIKPVSPIAPVAVLPTPVPLGACDTWRLNGGGSTGGAGRPLTYAACAPVCPTTSTM